MQELYDFSKIVTFFYMSCNELYQRSSESLVHRLYLLQELVVHEKYRSLNYAFNGLCVKVGIFVSNTNCYKLEIIVFVFNISPTRLNLL